MKRLAVLLFFLCSFSIRAQIQHPDFYSYAGREHVVSFEHTLEIDYTLAEVEAMDSLQREALDRNIVRPLLRFLYGPGTHRSLGSPQRGENVKILWPQIYAKGSKVRLPIEYRSLWILRRRVREGSTLRIPVPRQVSTLFTANWKACGDSDPEHQTPSFFWYFWDPERSGCDHVEGIHYDEVEINIGAGTINQSRSYPEYSRMFRVHEGQSFLQATVGFGYVDDPSNPDPSIDNDPGAIEYRDFVDRLRRALQGFHEDAIELAEYPEAFMSNRVIGRRFQGVLNQASVDLKVVMAAGVDQIHIFAKSFAHDHDGAFAWFGHSRVGSGFDAYMFGNLLRDYPDRYSISPEYQIIYWAGCNSYSYYTMPFFDFKRTLSDPLGTKNLDIIAHGLTSLFVLGSTNASVFMNAILNWQRPTSYQDIIQTLEVRASLWGHNLLAVVLGDEDNR